MEHMTSMWVVLLKVKVCHTSPVLIRSFVLSPYCCIRHHLKHSSCIAHWLSIVVKLFWLLWVCFCTNIHWWNTLSLVFQSD